jgi:hypothetical protein
MDFVHDELATGVKIRILTLLDTYSRYAHSVDARIQYRAGCSSNDGYEAMELPPA